MSGFALRLALPAFFKTAIFNQAGRAGPRRLVVITFVGVGMVAVLIGVSMISYRPPPQSAVAKMPPVNPLPGGTHSDPEQDALLLRDAQQHAARALEQHVSYTPPMPASQLVAPRPVVQQPDPSDPAPLPRHAPVVVTAPRPVPVPAAYTPSAVPHVQPVAAQVDPQPEQNYRRPRSSSRPGIRRCREPMWCCHPTPARRAKAAAALRGPRRQCQAGGMPRRQRCPHRL